MDKDDVLAIGVGLTVGAALGGLAAVLLGKPKRNVQVATVRDLVTKQGCALPSKAREGDTLVYRVDAAARRPACKTGVTAVGRWPTRVREHERGTVKSVRNFALPRRYTPLASCRTLPAASAFAHELEKLWGCVPTPGW